MGSFKLTENDKFIVCHIHELTDEIKETIRKHLSKICHGETLSKNGLSLYNYKNTLIQLKKRYNEKTAKIKKGMMGELLAHTIIHEELSNFETISPFFNMEEKSQRKGFDILLLSSKEKELWITEIKSGNILKNKSANQTIQTLLSKAKSDLKKRLSQSEETFWLNAINTVNVVVSDSKDYKSAITKILADEGVLAIDNKAISTDNNVILTSILFHDISKSFQQEIAQKTQASIEKSKTFKKVITFTIQKGTYKKLEQFLFTDEINAN